MTVERNIPLGQLLIEKGLITPQQLQAALEEQQVTRERLGCVLLRFGFISEEKVFLPLLAGQIGCEYVDVKTLDIPEEIIKLLPPKFASHYNAIPIQQDGDVLTIATPFPFDLSMTDAVETLWAGRIRTVLSSASDVAEVIRQHYGIGAETIDAMMGTKEKKGSPQESAVTDILEIDSEASIGKFINQVLLEAYNRRATDIHIEPFEDALRVRYRVDGILSDAQAPSNIWVFRDAINSRIKIMSRLNIAEKRLPQDGRFKVRVGGAQLDLRVSFLPTPYGESVVIRLLNSNRLFDLTELGLSDENLRILDGLIRKPHGIIFVTGPTGSGKTTTLYSCLSRINHDEHKIITIEDPIEYQLKGVVQLQINPAIHFTFASGLRSMLRHDPDVMMVGEVRDLETAEIAIQIALTGHLVFSTLHTNDAASGVTRLLDMGIEPYLISSAVECFIAQRLVRRICPKCKVRVQLDRQLARDLGAVTGGLSPIEAYAGRGCEFCNGSGFYGRQGIYEFLVLRDEIKEMIAQKMPCSKIKEKAVTLGMKTLLDDGWDKVLKGVTTAEEVLRVTQEDDQ
ncbi:MAG TPA: ATPase, T2SS/T4P/T4SS family [Candidatus Omnitrophota bacterium]|nr:ATPase, T2SS/T4P/T4SS family [Candidatus Omnitrophota bacterium]HSA30603.1 ATPase, T2SS/T4P/T4SS family [Candidatus Omnitrophota bacterium]